MEEDMIQKIKHCVVIVVGVAAMGVALGGALGIYAAGVATHAIMVLIQ
jgi:hypothetical protein